jgi:hypothetical protein
MSIDPQDLQKTLGELEASRSSRRRAWENLQEIRRVLKDTAGVELPPPAKKTIDLEGRLGVRKGAPGTTGCSRQSGRCHSAVSEAGGQQTADFSGFGFRSGCRGIEQGD